MTDYQFNIKIEALEQLKKGDFEKEVDRGVEFTDLLYDLVCQTNPTRKNPNPVKDKRIGSSIRFFKSLKPLLRLRLLLKARDSNKHYSYLIERQILYTREEIKEQMLGRFYQSLEKVGIPYPEIDCLAELRNAIEGITDMKKIHQLFDDFNLYISDLSKDLITYNEIDIFNSGFGNDILLIYSDVKRRIQPKPKRRLGRLVNK